MTCFDRIVAFVHGLFGPIGGRGRGARGSGFADLVHRILRPAPCGLMACTLLLGGRAYAGEPIIASTLPTLTAIAREVGGPRFEYVTLAKPDQDPHFVSPVPSLMQKLREAALLFEVGMQLEMWADQVADGAGNPRLYRGAAGRVPVSTGLPAEQVPSRITRAQGDLHPQGNPHLWLDPLRAKMIAKNMANAIASTFPEHRADVQERLEDFHERIDDALFGEELADLVGVSTLTRLAFDGRLQEFLAEQKLDGTPLFERAGGWIARARPLAGVAAAEFHLVWIYFCKTFGIELVGTIEEKPGIPPGPRHLREITQMIERRNVELILIDNFYDPALPRRIAEETGAEMVLLPNQVGGEPGTADYFALIDHILDEMLKALR